MKKDECGDLNYLINRDLVGDDEICEAYIYRNSVYAKDVKGWTWRYYIRSGYMSNNYEKYSLTRTPSIVAFCLLYFVPRRLIK